MARHMRTGKGVMIAARDLAAKREANKRIPNTEVVTRQRLRATQRQVDKGVGSTNYKGVFSYTRPDF